MSWLSTARHYDHFAKRATARGTFGNGPVDPERLHEIHHPVLSLVGTRDQFCPGTRLLAERIPNCQRIVIPGAGHLTSIRDPRFQEAAMRFLDSTPSRFAV